MKKIVLVGLTFILFASLFYLLITLPTWIVRLKYKIRGTEPINNSLVFPSTNAKNDISNISTNITDESGATKKVYRFPKDLVDNQLFIPKINLTAPINWGVATDDASLLNSLKTGLAHFNISSLPGEIGNIFVSGHSSYYWWDKGQYKKVFALLPEVKNGDAIYLKYQNKPYIYQVEETKVVKPTDISVVNKTDYPVISLMTCVPIGTAQNRLIVRAKQIYPQKSQVSQQRENNLQTIPKVW
ncbi:MAG: sortase family protein [Berkelbacteria bacterium GW2011_GWA2_35_9]|uniref:Sortase family protein n=1 Tax=Berkelbacteria bacterium GW2011_GWA2_35_9 TaxID=1618333 RepID=A0A0G0G9H7_9BACT|nr:MAG: sortase family protein [Berkelbacteria bacterium GW2011_GWA2_35_9]